MRHTILRYGAITLLAVVFTACELINPNGPQVAQSGPQAWIDAPLDGSSLPLAPYEVVMHGSDIAGITQFEFSVNGAVLTLIPSSDQSSGLAAVTQNWSPGGPGNYTLGVRAQNTAGTWSGVAQSVVTVGGDVPIDSSGEEPIPGESPTPTVTPTVTATLEPGITPSATTCVFDGAYVADVTVPDGTVFAPGVLFTKTWSLRNSGNCTWEQGVQLVLTGGDSMNSAGAASLAGIVPGEVFQVSIDMIAPNTPGSYTGVWGFRQPNGTLFGDSITVQIAVAATPTPTEEAVIITPLPTDEPPPPPTPANLPVNRPLLRIRRLQMSSSLAMRSLPQF